MSRSSKLFIAGGAVVVVVLVVAFGYFGVHTLFIDDKVDEAAPTFGAEGNDDAGDDGTDDGSGGDTTVEPPDVETLVEGSFVDRSHPAEGRAFVLTDGTDRVLRFEDFATDNGPDLFVYLSTADPDAPEGDFDDDFVDLGTLKGNIGDQNYEIGADVDLDRYSTVVIWCKRFGVAFGAAPLA